MPAGGWLGLGSTFSFCDFGGRWLGIVPEGVLAAFRKGVLAAVKKGVLAAVKKGVLASLKKGVLAAFKKRCFGRRQNSRRVPLVADLTHRDNSSYVMIANMP